MAKFKVEHTTTIRQKTGHLLIDLQIQKQELKLIVNSIFDKIDKIESSIKEHSEKEWEEYQKVNRQKND
jgi:hypothetical protein